MDEYCNKALKQMSRKRPNSVEYHLDNIVEDSQEGNVSEDDKNLGKINIISITHLVLWILHSMIMKKIISMIYVNNGNNTMILLICMM